MKFAHVADTHIGKMNFKLKEREEDFKDSFSEFIDVCINKKVDFVIHSGDLFDKPRPKTSLISFVVEQLKKLKQNNIPFYVVPGSHDMGVDGTFISVSYTHLTLPTN